MIGDRIEGIREFMDGPALPALWSAIGQLMEIVAGMRPVRTRSGRWRVRLVGPGPGLGRVRVYRSRRLAVAAFERSVLARHEVRS